MTSLVRAVAGLALVTLPLLLLTSLAFFHNGGTSTRVEYPSPNTVELDEIITAANKVKLAPSPALNVDPSGISVNERSGDLAIPLELAEVLAEGERACRSLDGNTVAKARRILDDFADKHLIAIETLRPSGVEMASALRARRSDIQRHATWLDNRQSVAKDLQSSESALTQGPEIEGEEACLAILRGMAQRFPTTADAVAAKQEPLDSLTNEEAAKAAALMSRANFRREFFTNRQAASESQSTALSIKQQVQAWDALAAISQTNRKDNRDAPLAEQIPELRAAAQLRFLEATAIEARSADALLRSVGLWLDHPKPSTMDRKSANQRAAELVRAWLESHVVALSPVRLEKGLKEGFRPGGKHGTRVFGYFAKVPNTERQYRWWSSDKARGDVRFAKGENQFNLQSDPDDPTYAIIFRRYLKAREVFLDSGHMSADGVNAFRSECSAILERFDLYRSAYAEEGKPMDSDAAAWGDVFSKSQAAADELLAAGNSANFWPLLSEAVHSR